MLKSSSHTSYECALRRLADSFEQRTGADTEFEHDWEAAQRYLANDEARISMSVLPSFLGLLVDAGRAYQDGPEDAARLLLHTPANSMLPLLSAEVRALLVECAVPDAPAVLLAQVVMQVSRDWMPPRP